MSHVSTRNLSPEEEEEEEEEEEDSGSTPPRSHLHVRHGHGAYARALGFYRPRCIGTSGGSMLPESNAAMYAASPAAPNASTPSTEPSTPLDLP